MKAKWRFQPTFATEFFRLFDGKRFHFTDATLAADRQDSPEGRRPPVHFRPPREGLRDMNPSPRKRAQRLARQGKTARK
jgi:hypothetical protein